MTAHRDPSLARFAPEGLLAELPGGAGPRAARRVVTVLLADLSGFTDLSESLDPERVVALLDCFFALVAESTRREGGAIDKFLGDACQVLFLDDPALDPAEVRAVRAALAIQEAMRGLPPLDVEFRATCAVETGEIVLALLDGGARSELAVTGPVVGEVARLQKLCIPGEVVSGGAALARLDPGALGLRADPVGEGAFRIRTSSSRSAEEPGLLGREAAIEAIEERLARLAAGRGGGLFLTGPGGSGRSRMLEVAAARAARLGLATLARASAGHAPGAFLAALFSDAAHDAALARLEAGAEAGLELDAADAARRLAGRSPFLLLVDDFDLLDAPSRRILAAAIPALAEAGGLLLASAAGAPPGAEPLPREPLGRFDAKRLVALRLPARAEDHPFLEQMVRAHGLQPGALVRACAPLDRATDRRLLRLVAAVGPLPRALACEALDAGPEELGAAVAALEALGLVRSRGGWLRADPAHAEGLEPEERARLHGRVGAALRARGMELDALPHEARGGAAERALAATHAIARRLVALGALEEARAELVRGLALARAEGRAAWDARLRIVEGGLLRRLGLFEEAATVLLAAHGAAADDADRVEAGLALAALFAARGRPELAHDCIVRARAAARGDEALEAAVERAEAGLGA